MILLRESRRMVRFATHHEALKFIGSQIILSDLAIALNYGLGTGSAQLLRWITEHTEACNPCIKRTYWNLCRAVG